MEDSRGRRRQNDPPTHAASNSRYQPLHDPSQQQQQQQQQAAQQQQAQQRRNYTANPRESYRPGPITTSSSSSSSSSAAAAAAAVVGSQRMGGSAGYSGYYQDSSGNFATPNLPQAGMSYHQAGAADYGQVDARQTGGFAANTYNPMVYNVPQAANTQGAAVYDTSQSFAQRQPAAIQIMPTDVNAAYFQGDASQSAPALQAQTASSSSSQAVYQQPGMSNYSGNMASSAIGGMAAQPGAASADVSMEEEYPASGGLDEAYQSYQSALKGVFSSIRSGGLRDASESLLNISDWLLGHVSELGLTSDDTSLHSDRIKLWNDFNHAWLALLQRQKELMESGSHSSSLIKQDLLNKMGKDLVRLCDAIEPHGLVDYQYGVWEEQIIDILEQCLDLYEQADDSNSNAAGSSSQNR